jgi:glycosyltransferase involved in cell wall biosynthesis
MPQLANLPCAKIVLCQAYDHVLETLQPGQNWVQFGFTKCIVTSESQKEYVSAFMKNISYDIIPPVISENFVKQELPPKPIIAIHTRDQRDTMTLIKTFYLKYPQYRWVTFRDMRGLSEKEFANALKDCFLSVWIDPTSGFGTFPLESMKVGVPVIGKIPNMFPEWMNEDNGLWIREHNQIVDFVSDFLHNWLEDNINESLYENIESTAKAYSDTKKFERQVVDTFTRYIDTRLEPFQEQLTKLETTEK